MDPLPLLADHAFRCVAGETWEWDGVRFELLYPERASYALKLKDNDLSCVLRITAPGGTVLLPGDIERRAEETLVAAHTTLHADVLIAPHQGSKTSSTPSFLDAVQPALVVFPVGYRNRFGHPHPEVVERYRQRGAAIYRTDSDGAVSIALTPETGIRVESHRAVYRRYWHDPPVRDERLLEE